MQVNRTALSAALRDLVRLAPSKPTMPILGHVLAHAENGQLILRASDTETALTAELAADGDLAPVCLPLKSLAALCKASARKDAGDVSIDLDGATAIIAVDGATSKLPTLPADDFPREKDEPGYLIGVWPERPFAEAINHVLPAVSNDPTRPHLCCVALIADVAVGVDGHRMHTAHLPVAVPEKLLLPVSAAGALVRILTGDDHAVVVARSDKRLVLRVRGWTLETKLVDASFPPYEQVIPRSSANHLSVDAAQLTKALKRLAAMSPGHGVRVVVNGVIELGLDDPERGEMKVTVVPTENDHVGEDLVLGVAPAYLIDALGKDAHPVRIGVGGCLDPFVVSHDDGRLAVVMPMRV